jgi:hypothetical protein
MNEENHFKVFDSARAEDSRKALDEYEEDGIHPFKDDPSEGTEVQLIDVQGHFLANAKMHFLAEDNSRGYFCLNDGLPTKEIIARVKSYKTVPPPSPHVFIEYVRPGGNGQILFSLVDKRSDSDV